MSGANAVEIRINDPLLYRKPLPYTGRYYPYGFPVDVASDMREVLDAAEESFGAYAARFDRPPLRLHVLTSQGDGVRPPDPVLRGQRHLLQWVSDRENFAAIDRRERFGYCCVTRATVADRIFFRWHFLEAQIYILLELSYFTSLHAACVAREEGGVLLRDARHRGGPDLLSVAFSGGANLHPAGPELFPFPVRGLRRSGRSRRIALRRVGCG